MRTCGWAIALLVVGCRPPEPPQFSRSAELQALSEFAEADDGESVKLWQGLQTQIEAELAQRCGTPLAPVVLGDPEADRARLKLGAQVYAYRCQQCHGVGGTGQSSLTQYLDPKPRDYTKGIFKFTSTPYNAKPRRSDLLRTVRRGVSGTSMPSFDDLDPEDLEAVVDYVIYLSQRGELEQELVQLAQDEEELADDLVQESVDTVRNRWTEAQSQLVMPVTPMPAMTADTIAKGRELYLQQVCNKCHGVDGRGGLAGNIEIGKDAWGHETAAADLTSGLYRGGGRPIDIYRRIYSGINGTPMPGFAQTLANEPDNFWYLVHFIRDTGERRRRNLSPEAAPAQPAAPTPPEVPAAEPAVEPAAEPETAPDSKAAAAARSADSISSVPQS
jgi:mono/diheme cytochrome c family protein